MLAYIYHKTIWKYNSTNDDYNKIMINNIINKDKTSELNYLYKKSINEISYEQKYINKLYNLYQSIKLLINITESKNNNLSIYHPKLLNRHFNKFFSKNLESQNKIKVKRLSKNEKRENKNNDIKMDNSLSSIKITIDLDERDNYQNGCPDFATGNEMYYLLKNIQQSPSDCLYNNYFRNCNIYKKKKSPQVSFRIFSPKNRRFFGENKFFDNPIKNNMINNNIFINNNNYNNHTNFFINDYNINENINNNNNSNEKNLIIKKKRYHHFGNYKYQTHTHIISSRFNNRNRLSIPQSQSCEKFIYKKKYISSKVKEKRNKTAEEFEKDTQEKDKEENEIYNENNLNDIKIKYIPLIHKNSNIKILENLDNNDDDADADDKALKIEKINYIGRNDFNTNKDGQNKYPFLLSRITKNSKTNRKPSLTQEEYLTKFNSTFNLNIQNNYKTKQIKPNKPKIEDNISNNKNNNLKKIKKANNENNTLLKLNNKKEKKVVKRKETNLKFKKNNTAKSNLTTTNNNILKEKVLTFGKKIKKEKKLEKDQKLEKEKKFEKDKKIEKGKKIEKESKDLKKRIKEEKKSKPINLLNPKRFNSPLFNRDSLTNIISPDHLTCKNRTKRISFKELLNQRISIDFSNVNKSNTYLNYDLNKFDSTKAKNKNLLNSKSNGYINSISKQLFSPTKRDSITANKISFVNNEKYIDNYNDTNNYICNEENLNNSYYKTLPTKKEENEKTIVLSKSENNKLVLNKFVTKKKQLKEIPIKVNLNRNSINKISHSKLSTLNKNNYQTEKTLESNKKLTTGKNNSLKRKVCLDNNKKNNKNIKIELNSFQ